MESKYNGTPKDIFKGHYGELVNPATPVVVEYGWVIAPVSAYELSTNQTHSLFGVTVVSVIDGETVEQETGRWAGFSETAAREHVSALRVKWTPQ